MSEEDLNVSQIGHQWGRSKHRKMRIERCANGYTVEYDKVIETRKLKAVNEFSVEEEAMRVVRETRVFITNSDLLEFVEEYFSGEPRP